AEDEESGGHEERCHERDGEERLAPQKREETRPDHREHGERGRARSASESRREPASELAKVLRGKRRIADGGRLVDRLRVGIDLGKNLRVEQEREKTEDPPDEERSLGERPPSLPLPPQH